MTINQKEKKYINASARDSKQDICAYPDFIILPGLPNNYTIECKNLPKGTYNFNSNKVCMFFGTRYDFEHGIKTNVTWSYDPNHFSFTVTEPGEVKIEVKNVINIRKYVQSLRRQALANLHNQESLIQKDIKKHTDLGEEYNRTSFYDTIDECLIDGEDLIVDQTKSATDSDVKYLKLMRLEQLSVKLYEEQQRLNQARKELEQEANELLK